MTQGPVMYKNITRFTAACVIIILGSSNNGLQGKPGEPVGLPIFPGETPVFHHFIVILPFWPNNLLSAYQKLSCCAVAGLNALSSTIYQFSCHYLLITYPKTLDSITYFVIACFKQFII